MTKCSEVEVSKSWLCANVLNFLSCLIFGFPCSGGNEISKKIKELRYEQGVLQRQLAALLEIDTPMFSKIERGDRKAKREQVIKIAEYFHQDVNEMLTLWLADKVLDAVENEDAINLAAIKIAKGEIKAKNT